MSVLLLISIIVPLVLGTILLASRHFDKFAGWLTSGILAVISILLIIATVLVR